MGYDQPRRTDTADDSSFLSSTLAGQLSRRSLLRRALALGAATPVIAGLLAACGSSSSSSSSSSSASSAATATSSSSTPSGSTATAAATTPAATAAASPSSVASPSASPTGSPQASVGSVTTGGPVTITKYKVEAVGKTGGKMIYGSPSDAKTLLSIITTDGPSFTVIDMIFEALTQGDPDNGQPMSWLAKSWEISADGLTYTFTLQDGVNWQDGQPLTANDVKFTYDLILNPDTKSSFTSDLQSKLKSMNVIDDTHIAFNLKAPNAAFLALSTTTGYEIIPQHILKDVPAAKLASDTFTTGAKGRTIGTGPFLFQEWVKDDHVLVVKNPNYWGGAPALDQWFYKVVPSSSVLTQQLRTGDVDFGAIQPADYASMTK
ncbi:MAG TPA: ABC transporter substrate-binding protein, partial [Thermomicrobiaceae bacterium]|nr:ABC transporter substrate-binding protein [Thermomicrobiaceae bacterium]